jgi:hypothetical protein
VGNATFATDQRLNALARRAHGGVEGTDQKRPPSPSNYFREVHMRSRPGSFRALAGHLVAIYGLRYAIWVPLVLAAVVAVFAGVVSPGRLEANATHEHWSPLFGATAQVIATLLVALVVEVHTPFTRGGELAARVAAAFAGVMLGAGGVAALIALSPSLPDPAYRILFAVATGGATGGFVAVVMIGISVVIGTVTKVDEESLKRLAEAGDPSAVEVLLRRRGRL